MSSTRLGYSSCPSTRKLAQGYGNDDGDECRNLCDSGEYSRRNARLKASVSTLVMASEYPVLRFGDVSLLANVG
jgi:hypothetical protein